MHKLQIPDFPLTSARPASTNFRTAQEFFLALNSRNFRNWVKGSERAFAASSRPWRNARSRPKRPQRWKRQQISREVF